MFNGGWIGGDSGEVLKHEPHADHDYKEGEFVSVVTNDDGNTSFWMTKILDTCSNSAGIIDELRVVWYEPKSGTGKGDPINATYVMFHRSKSKDMFIDYVSVSTMICTFYGLTKQKNRFDDITEYPGRGG